MDIPVFQEKKALFSWLSKNKELLIAEKKHAKKFSDELPVYVSNPEKKGTATKNILTGNNDLLVEVIMNTTNVFDSHGDVHLNGLWEKTIKETKKHFHVQEHKIRFENIIADGDDVSVFTKNDTFANLGFQMEGETQALIFKSIIKSTRNPFMYSQYIDGYVEGHSVGMVYVKYSLAINDTDYPDEYNEYQKYYPQIANKSELDKVGWFWAIKEARLVEGSAVVMPSNIFTRTQSIQEIEPQQKSTLFEPQKSTQKFESIFEIINNKL